MNLPSSESHITEFEREILAFLVASERMPGVVVYPMSAQSILAKIQRTVAKLGVVGFLEMGDANVSNPNTAVPRFDEQSFRIRIVENTLINRSPGKLQIPARQIAIGTVFALHGARPTSPEFVGRRIRCDKPTVRHITNDRASIYEARFII